ncbi:Kinesin-like protein KIFC3 [Cynara cardunculus var. scolymus]|uniref:Kinesin-like protein n=1 Tax=Cynara cardunculus var. scolymus TaxID=59895 RepID=A0A118JVE6_CYNCS|nr:Kinesin-like protein KIFC3 [Cynara cardunculus var. scolymus]
MEGDRFDPLLMTDVPWQQQQQQHQHQHETWSHYPVASFQTSLTTDPYDLCFNKIEEISMRNRLQEETRAKDCMDPIGNDVLDEISWRNSSSDAIGSEDVLDYEIMEKGHCKLGFSLTSPDLVICSGSPDIPNRAHEDSPKLLNRSSIELSLENGITEGPKITDYNHTQTDPTEDLDNSEASFELLPLAPCDDNDDHKDEGEGCDEPQEDYENQREELMKAKREVEMMKLENERKSKECKEALKSLRELQNELMRKSMHVGSLGMNLLSKWLAKISEFAAFHFVVLAAFAVEGQVKEKSKWFSSLRDMSRKLKIMKMDQIKLLEEGEAYKKCAADMNEMSSIIQSRIDEHVKQHEDLKIRFSEGAKERKELYNKIQELKGNIRVFCRCRPLNSEEIAEGASMAFDFEASRDGELRVKSNVAFKRNFKFDAVFSPQANQVDVFEDTSPFATSVLDGYNVCIFAYGQTGTGKTFTMEGTDEDRGVNFRTLEELFRVIDERKNQVQQDGEGLHHVPGLVESQVTNMSEVWEVLKTGSNARAVGSTNANEHSSRSHCIHCVMVKGENLVNGECTRSKLWLVDLAGSERVAKTEVQGERLKETQNINRSLSALGDVISALATKSSHIPFRNSKLTHLLQDSLGGDSKTLMFLQISPNENDLSESLCSLNFASRVRGIELGPAKKQIESSEVLKYKQMAERYKHEMKSKDLQIKKMEDNFHGLDMKLKERELKNKNLQDKVKELESQLLVERKLARQHVDTKIAEQQMRQQQQDEPSSRPPLAPKLLKNFEETKDNPANIVQPPLVEKNTTTYKTLPPPLPPARDLVNLDDCIEKENNPYLPEPFTVPKRTGRASICTTTTQRVPVRSVVPRRNSLIPLPPPVSTKLCPLPSIEGDNENVDMESPLATDSPKRSNGGGKKLMSALRRSLHKKNQMKTPMMQQPQQIRRVGGGLNVAVERVRVSIGSRGRMAHRVVNNGRRGKQQNYMEKERRWNIGKGGL